MGFSLKNHPTTGVPPWLWKLPYEQSRNLKVSQKDLTTFGEVRSLERTKRIYGGFLSHAATSIDGWFKTWEIRIENVRLGIPLWLRNPPYSKIRGVSLTWTWCVRRYDATLQKGASLKVPSLAGAGAAGGERSPEGTSPKPMFANPFNMNCQETSWNQSPSSPSFNPMWIQNMAEEKTRKNHLSPHLETNYDHEKPGKSHEIPHLSSLPRRRTSIRPGSHFGAGSDLSLKSEWAKGRLFVAWSWVGSQMVIGTLVVRENLQETIDFPLKYETYRNYGG